MGVFNDIQGAFDNALLELLKKSVEKWGATFTMVRWIGVTLKNRHIKTAVNETRLTVQTVKGSSEAL